MKIAIDLAIVVGFCPRGQHMPGTWAFNFPSSSEVLKGGLAEGVTHLFRLHGGRSGGLRFANPPYETYPRVIARLATASAISTNADVTSGPPTKIRVGVFILFHS